MTSHTSSKYIALVVSVLALVAGACSSNVVPAAETTSPVSTETTEIGEAIQADNSNVASQATDESTETGTTVSGTVAFIAEVWADNWFALYVNGELVGEDSVPITTERSFNAETITFEASYPLTIAIQAKDYIETDSGLEYIGASNQQMGDGGIIAQITDQSTGEVVATTSSDWTALVVHQAPLNAECEEDVDPDATCEYLISEIPVDWTSAAFDDTAWADATVWTSAAVDPKGGYDDVVWDPFAEFIWGSDLEVDNTVLLRLTVRGA